MRKAPILSDNAEVAVYFGGGAFIPLHDGYTRGPMAGHNIEAVYGVSCGSLWASLMGFCGPVVGDFILGSIQKTSDIFHTKDIFSSMADTMGRKWASLPVVGLGFGPLESLIKQKIVGKPSIPVTISFCNLETERHVHATAYPDGTFGSDDDIFPVNTLQDFQNALLSSCLVYPMVDAYLDYHNNGFIDGGFREGGPVEIAIGDVAKVLHICLTGLYSQTMDFSGNANDPLSGVTRELEIMANQNVITAVNAALRDASVDVLLYQAVPQGTSTNFNQTDIQENIKIGLACLPLPGNAITIIE